MRAENREAERDEAILGGQPVLEQPLDFLTRMRHLPERLLPRLGIRLGAAVKKRGANARRDQAIDARISVRGRRVVVTPINQRGGAAIDLVQPAHQVGDGDVFGLEHRR